MHLAVRYRVDTHLNIAEIRSGSNVFLVPIRILEEMFRDRFTTTSHGEYPFTIEEWQKLCRNQIDPIRKGYYGRKDDQGLPLRWPRRKRKEYQ
jgi:hypothetical protein